MSAPIEIPSTPLALPETREWQLANGMHVIVAERRGLPLVAARLEVDVGSAQEPRNKAGLAELMGQLMRRGTKKRTSDAIDEAIERVGGSLGVDVDVDSAAISGSLPAEHLGVALDVVADLAMNAKFPQAEVSSARARTLAGLANDLDDPSTVADRAASWFALAGHPYGTPATGFQRTVKTFTRTDVVAFYTRAFTPARAALFIVGDLGGANVEALVKKHFGAWKGAAVEVPALPPLPRPTGKNVIIVDKDDATQTQLRIVAGGIPRNDPDYFDCVIASSVLGGGFTSRLMDEIRVNRGLSYGVSSRFYSYRFGGEFVISTFTKTETTAECVQVALDVTRGLAEKGASIEELARTKTYVNGLYPLQLETNEQMARVLADVRLYGIGSDYVARFRERVLGVTPDGLQAAARARFPIGDYLLLAVGKARVIRKALEPFGKVTVKKLADLA